MERDGLAGSRILKAASTINRYTRRDEYDWGSVFCQSRIPQNEFIINNKNAAWLLFVFLVSGLLIEWVLESSIIPHGSPIFDRSDVNCTRSLRRNVHQEFKRKIRRPIRYSVTQDRIFFPYTYPCD